MSEYKSLLLQRDNVVQWVCNRSSAGFMVIKTYFTVIKNKLKHKCYHSVLSLGQNSRFFCSYYHWRTCTFFPTQFVIIAKYKLTFSLCIFLLPGLDVTIYSEVNVLYIIENRVHTNSYCLALEFFWKLMLKKKKQKTKKQVLALIMVNSKYVLCN